MMHLFWWGKHIVIVGLSILFLLLGVETLFRAYTLKNPYEFVLFFFGSNLIILISITALLYPVIRIYLYLKSRKHITEQNRGL